MIQRLDVVGDGPYEEMGEMIQTVSALKDFQLQNPHPTVLHLIVR